MSELKELLQKYAKPAYFASLSGDEPDDVTKSKFGGRPYFENGESWPLCKKCQQPEFFICQLDMRECPATGLADYFQLVSFFYCWKCFPWDPEQPGWTLMHHRQPSIEKALKIEMPPLPKQGMLAKFIEGEPKPTKPCSITFTQFKSYPQMDEIDEFGDEDDRDLLDENDIADEYYELIEELEERKMDYDTIIGGWAEWIQSLPEIRCEKCQNQMDQLMQIGSEAKANIMFGDAGAAYFHFCKSHPELVKFCIQCF